MKSVQTLAWYTPVHVEETTTFTIASDQSLIKKFCGTNHGTKVGTELAIPENTMSQL